MDCRPNITPVEVIKKKLFDELISGIFILVLMINGIKAHGKILLC